MALDREAVEHALDEIRHYLQMDGGDCELVDIDGNNVMLRMVGACHGCPSSQMTIQNGIAKHLRDHFPEFGEVIAV